MKQVDIIIVGGGMVGLVLAQALRHTDLMLVVLEANPPDLTAQEVAYRVSALNLSSERMLTEFGIWHKLLQQRATPYQQMDIWEKDSFARLQFSTQGLGLEHLGHIVENQLLQQQLWHKVAQQKNCEILTALPERLAITDDNAILSLANGEMLSAKLVVGADGANSWVRQQSHIPLSWRDYGHYALVANVITREPHQHCARQIFSPQAILAFLPLHQQNLCSIVWSLPPEQAKELVACDTAHFNKALTVAFDHRLGLCELASDRQIYPLTARYARQFAQARVALVGDAAHTIHPLAGLGVNLGFQDALALAQQISLSHQKQQDIGLYRHLRHYEQWRKTEAVKLLVAMQGLKDLFTGQNPVQKLIRGLGLSAVDKLQPLKQQLIKQALLL